MKTSVSIASKSAVPPNVAGKSKVANLNALTSGRRNTDAKPVAARLAPSGTARLALRGAAAKPKPVNTPSLRAEHNTEGNDSLGGWATNGVSAHKPSSGPETNNAPATAAPAGDTDTTAKTTSQNTPSFGSSRPTGAWSSGETPLSLSLAPGTSWGDEMIKGDKLKPLDKASFPELGATPPPPPEAKEFRRFDALAPERTPPAYSSAPPASASSHHGQNRPATPGGGGGGPPHGRDPAYMGPVASPVFSQAFSRRDGHSHMGAAPHHRDGGYYDRPPRNGPTGDRGGGGSGGHYGGYHQDRRYDDYRDGSAPHGRPGYHDRESGGPHHKDGPSAQVPESGSGHRGAWRMTDLGDVRSRDWEHLRGRAGSEGLSVDDSAWRGGPSANGAPAPAGEPPASEDVLSRARGRSVDRGMAAEPVRARTGSSGSVGAAGRERLVSTRIITPSGSTPVAPSIVPLVSSPDPTANLSAVELEERRLKQVEEQQKAAKREQHLRLKEEQQEKERLDHERREKDKEIAAQIRAQEEARRNKASAPPLPPAGGAIRYPAQQQAYPPHQYHPQPKSPPLPPRQAPLDTLRPAPRAVGPGGNRVLYNPETGHMDEIRHGTDTAYDITQRPRSERAPKVGPRRKSREMPRDGNAVNSEEPEPSSYAVLKKPTYVRSQVNAPTAAPNRPPGNHQQQQQHSQSQQPASPRAAPAPAGPPLPRAEGVDKPSPSSTAGNVWAARKQQQAAAAQSTQPSPSPEAQAPDAAATNDRQRPRDTAPRAPPKPVFKQPVNGGDYGPGDDVYDYYRGAPEDFTKHAAAESKANPNVHHQQQQQQQQAARQARGPAGGGRQQHAGRRGGDPIQNEVNPRATEAQPGEHTQGQEQAPSPRKYASISEDVRIADGKATTTKRHVLKNNKLVVEPPDGTPNRDVQHKEAAVKPVKTAQELQAEAQAKKDAAKALRVKEKAARGPRTKGVKFVMLPSGDIIDADTSEGRQALTAQKEKQFFHRHGQQQQQHASDEGKRNPRENRGKTSTWHANAGAQAKHHESSPQQQQQQQQQHLGGPPKRSRAGSSTAIEGKDLIVGGTVPLADAAGRRPSMELPGVQFAKMDVSKLRGGGLALGGAPGSIFSAASAQEDEADAAIDAALASYEGSLEDITLEAEAAKGGVSWVSEQRGIDYSMPEGEDESFEEVKSRKEKAAVARATRAGTAAASAATSQATPLATSDPRQGMTAAPTTATTSSKPSSPTQESSEMAAPGAVQPGTVTAGGAVLAHLTPEYYQQALAQAHSVAQLGAGGAYATAAGLASDPYAALSILTAGNVAWSAWPQGGVVPATGGTYPITMQPATAISAPVGLSATAGPYVPGTFGIIQPSMVMLVPPPAQPQVQQPMPGGATRNAGTIGIQLLGNVNLPPAMRGGLPPQPVGQQGRQGQLPQGAPAGGGQSGGGRATRRFDRTGGFGTPGSTAQGNEQPQGSGLNASAALWQPSNHKTSAELWNSAAAASGWTPGTAWSTDQTDMSPPSSPPSFLKPAAAVEKGHSHHHHASGHGKGGPAPLALPPPAAPTAHDHYAIMPLVDNDSTPQVVWQTSASPLSHQQAAYGGPMAGDDDRLADVEGDVAGDEGAEELSGPVGEEEKAEADDYEAEAMGTGNPEAALGRYPTSKSGMRYGGESAGGYRGGRGAGRGRAPLRGGNRRNGAGGGYHTRTANNAAGRGGKPTGSRRGAGSGVYPAPRRASDGTNSRGRAPAQQAA